MSSPSRTVRVFISSTFRDFGEERDLLVKRVFPELRRRARERLVEVIGVDLRWSMTEEESERGETLPICLREIERSRPYFIGLLGERYGWTPAAGEYPELLMAQQPWLREHAGGASVTELEVLHGVLNDPEMAGRAFFFFRDPAWAEGKGPDFASEGEGERARLARLKERIRASRFPVVEYRTPEEVAERITDDLWRLIDAEYPQEEVPDELERMRRGHEAYAAERRRLYVGQEETVGRLLGRIESASDEPGEAGSRTRITVVTGESGTGKSALVANVMEAYRGRRPGDLVIEHYLGSSAEAAEPPQVMQYLCEEINRRLQLPIPVATLPHKIEPQFFEWLEEASDWADRQGIRLILAMDGLDLLVARQDLSWLPRSIPPRIRMVISSGKGASLDALQARGLEITEVPRLGAAGAQAFIVRKLARNSRRMPTDDVFQIASHAHAPLPLFLETLVEELLVFGSFDELPRRLGECLAAIDLPDLFCIVLARIEHDLGLTPVRNILQALWASPNGMSEPELVAFTGATPLELARLRLSLGNSLHEPQGKIQIVHASLRTAVRDRYIVDNQEQRRLHGGLARFWLSMPASRLASTRSLEHLEMSHDADGLKTVLGRSDLLIPFIEHLDCKRLFTAFRIATEDDDAAARVLLDSSIDEACGRIGDEQLARQCAFVENAGLLLQHAGVWHGKAAASLSRRFGSHLASQGSVDLHVRTQDMQDPDAIRDNLARVVESQKGDLASLTMPERGFALSQLQLLLDEFDYRLATDLGLKHAALRVDLTRVRKTHAACIEVVSHGLNPLDWPLRAYLRSGLILVLDDLLGERFTEAKSRSRQLVAHVEGWFPSGVSDNVNRQICDLLCLSITSDFKQGLFAESNSDRAALRRRLLDLRGRGTVVEGDLAQLEIMDFLAHCTSEVGSCDIGAVAARIREFRRRASMLGSPRLQVQVHQVRLVVASALLLRGESKGARDLLRDLLADLRDHPCRDREHPVWRKGLLVALFAFGGSLAACGEVVDAKAVVAEGLALEASSAPLDLEDEFNRMSIRSLAATLDLPVRPGESHLTKLTEARERLEHLRGSTAEQPRLSCVSSVAMAQAEVAFRGGDLALAGHHAHAAIEADTEMMLYPDWLAASERSRFSNVRRWFQMFSRNPPDPSLEGVHRSILALLDSPSSSTLTSATRCELRATQVVICNHLEQVRSTPEIQSRLAILAEDLEVLHTEEPSGLVGLRLAYDLLAEAAMEAGDTDQALELWERALARNAAIPGHQSDVRHRAAAALLRLKVAIFASPDSAADQSLLRTESKEGLLRSFRAFVAEWRDPRLGADGHRSVTMMNAIHRMVLSGKDGVSLPIATRSWLEAADMSGRGSPDPRGDETFLAHGWQFLDAIAKRLGRWGPRTKPFGRGWLRNACRRHMARRCTRRIFRKGELVTLRIDAWLRDPSFDRTAAAFDTITIERSVGFLTSAENLATQLDDQRWARRLNTRCEVMRKWLDSPVEPDNGVPGEDQDGA